jgi:CubicO group peptidase (beta-lactamase class C family)
VTARFAALVVSLAIALTGLAAQQPSPATALTAAPPFESYIEALRLQGGVPGISAALIQDRQIVWERGFGFQNQEARIRATPDTPYPIADMSQTMASVLLLQCAEQRRVELDDQVRKFGVSLPEAQATVRHVLTHTSAGTPGETFKYDHDRYAQLTPIVEACIPQPYRKSVAVVLLDRLAMRDSVPGRDLVDPNVLPERIFGADTLDRYRRVLERLAVPYKVDKKGRLTRTELPPEGMNAASGLVSTVRDLARFDAALDSALLLREDTLAVAWSNTANAERSRVLPTGLGWFVQNYKGESIVWHFGLIPNAYSSLILKLPSRRLTLILLANSDGLSAPFELENGDITRSLFATVFLRLFA